jgi:hypothetical protein
VTKAGEMRLNDIGNLLIKEFDSLLNKRGKNGKNRLLGNCGEIERDLRWKFENSCGEFGDTVDDTLVEFCGEITRVAS